MSDHKTCIIIAGPTASGKTKLSLQLADYFNTAIISADSRQCYKELNICVAKPPAAALNQIRHYFINSHSIYDEVNAGVFEQYALQAVSDIFVENDIAIMVGGTGLYIKAFSQGMDKLPPVDENIRTDLRAQYDEKGMRWLQEMIKTHDPLFYEKGEIQNPQRMLRALEIKLSAGSSILAWHSAPVRKRDFSIIKIGTLLSRDELYNNINNRVEGMMEEGLLEEVKGLYNEKHLNALQTVGYTEIFDHIDGNCSLEKAVDDIQKHTRHYAKRQMTWFNRDETIRWFAPDDLEGILQYIESKKEIAD